MNLSENSEKIFDLSSNQTNVKDVKFYYLAVCLLNLKKNLSTSVFLKKRINEFNFANEMTGFIIL